MQSKQEGAIHEDRQKLKILYHIAARISSDPYFHYYMMGHYMDHVVSENLTVVEPSESGGVGEFFSGGDGGFSGGGFGGGGGGSW